MKLNQESSISGKIFSNSSEVSSNIKQGSEESYSREPYYAKIDEIKKGSSKFSEARQYFFNN
jgi:hypothetical protein